jgi:hypothetical protein
MAQATLELLARARRSPFDSPAHVENVFDWTILAGIGKVECDHGRDPDPSCTVEGFVGGDGGRSTRTSVFSPLYRRGSRRRLNSALKKCSRSADNRVLR